MGSIKIRHPENVNECVFTMFNLKVVSIQQLERYWKNYIRPLYNNAIFKKLAHLVE